MKVMKKAIIFMVSIVFLILCIGCGSESNSDSLEKKLVGSWNDEDGTEMMVFYKDGAYRHGRVTGANVVNGDYKVLSENELELTTNQSGLGQDMLHIAGIHKFELDGDELHFSSRGALEDVTYYRAK